MSYTNKIPSFISLLCAVLLIAGLYSFASACPVHEDGHFMYCHLAELVCLVLAYLIAILGFSNLLSSHGMFKCGTDWAILLVCVVLFFIPDHIIPLCAMEHMRCRSVMQPFATVVSVLLFLVSLADILVNYARNRNQIRSSDGVARS